MSSKPAVSTTTTNNQCCAATATGPRCKNSAIAKESLCVLHKGKDSEVQFEPQVLQVCSAQTKAGKRCTKSATKGDLCGTHARDPLKPRKESSRKGKQTGYSLFTSDYWANHKEAGTKDEANATDCAQIWKAEKAKNSAFYLRYMEKAKAHQ
jgi:hypothetical protein